MLQGFYEKRHLRRDGVELLGYDTIAAGSAVALAHPDLAGVQYPTDIGAALFEQERKRTGGLIDMELRPTDNLSLDLSGFFSKLDAPNYNRNYLLWNTHFINSGAGQAPDPGYVVTNNTLTKATFTGCPGTLYGVYDQISRPDERRPPTTSTSTANFTLHRARCPCSAQLASPRATARPRPRMSRRRIRAPTRAAQWSAERH